MKKKMAIGLSVVIIIAIIIVIYTIFFIINQNKNGSEEQISSLPVSYDEEYKDNANLENNTNNDQEKIDQITENQGLQADENIYEIATEYDGREIVRVKPSIQYNVALAGMIKKEIPDFSELDNLLTQAPTHTGIWIEETSRENFLNILNNITDSEYEINEEGFLIRKKNGKMNDYDKEIQDMLSDNVLHIFDINSTTYIIDEVTGEIQEYPFEEMDPYTEYEYFSTDDKEMFIISANSYGKVDQEEILKGIFDY